MTRPTAIRSLARRAIAAVAIIPLVAVGFLAASTGAASATPVPTPAAHSAAVSTTHSAAHSTSAAILGMRHASASSFARAASRLPANLVTAIHRDLGISAESYLADADASSRAVEVVKSLTAHGVHVLGSQISGTHLTVNVASKRDVAAVTTAGATAIIGSPTPEALPTKFVPAAAIYDGEPYIIEKTGIGAFQCSIGFTGISTIDQSLQPVTAGHCLAGSRLTDPILVPVSATKPGELSGTLSNYVAVAHTVGAEFGDGNDAGLMSLISGNTQTTKLATWGGGKGLSSSSSISVTGETEAIKGAHLCKSGSRTGWTCGKVLAVNRLIQVNDEGTIRTVNSIAATTCILPGDSGGAAVIGSLAVGINSSTSSATKCTGKHYESNFFPMLASSGHASVATEFGTTWELAAAVSTPVVANPTSDTTVRDTDTLRGTLAGAGAGDKISLYLDGSSTLTVISGASGSWSFPLSAISHGHHTFRVVASLGKYSVSSDATGAFTNLPTTVVTKPTIGGSAVVGSTITASTTATPSGAIPSYQWKSNGANVGANSATYTPVAADHGHTITVTASASLSGYANAASQTSSATGKVKWGTLSTHAPAVTGTRNVGQTLTATVSPWGPASVALKFTWLRSGKAISGAHANTYLLASADKGKKINVEVTGTLSGYTTATVESAKTHTETGARLLTATPVPTISGAVQVHGVLTATAGSWQPSHVALSYQWKVAGKSVSGGTHSTFTVPASAVGKTITVTVKGKKSGYLTVSKTSAPTVSVAAIPFLQVISPTITGSEPYKLGEKLKSERPSWTPAATFTYHWTRNGVDIPNATKSSYTLTSADMAAITANGEGAIRLVEKGTRTGYVTQSLVSVS